MFVEMKGDMASQDKHGGRSDGYMKWIEMQAQSARKSHVDIKAQIRWFQDECGEPSQGSMRTKGIRVRGRGAAHRHRHITSSECSAIYSEHHTASGEKLTCCAQPPAHFQSSIHKSGFAPSYRDEGLSCCQSFQVLLHRGTQNSSLVVDSCQFLCCHVKGHVLGMWPLLLQDQRHRSCSLRQRKSTPKHSPHALPSSRQSHIQLEPLLPAARGHDQQVRL